jgi:hypothetical protein
MTAKILAAAIAAVLLPVASFAQTSSGAGSTRCDSLAGAAKDQCVRDETRKADGGPVSPGADAPIPGTSLGTPSTSVGSTTGSARCAALPGTQKDDCLRSERTRDEGAATSGAGSPDRVGPGSTGMGR